MIKVENIEVFNFEGAIRGARNPMNSWSRSDSHTETDYANNTTKFVIGEKDLDLMRRLYKAGPEHRKYLRQIFVSMDITAPLYMLKEFDTYKIGTVSNSCSTMHRITAKKFTPEDFSNEHLFNISKLQTIINWLNDYRDIYINWDDNKPWYDDDGNEVTKKDIWWQLIQLLPSSYNQKRTITMNYENVVTIIKQRSGHKLDEWKTLVDILKDLPYIKEIIND